jgi:hypothetical protein
VHVQAGALISIQPFLFKHRRYGMNNHLRPSGTL